jgi:ribosomal protein L15
MEIAESIGWVALGFLPVFGSMEVAWRLGKRGFLKPSTKRTIMKKVSVDALHK